MASREMKRKARGYPPGKTRVLTDDELSLIADRDARAMAVAIQAMDSAENAGDVLDNLQEKIDRMVQAKMRQLLAESEEEEDDNG